MSADKEAEGVTFNEPPNRRSIQLHSFPAPPPHISVNLRSSADSIAWIRLTGFQEGRCAGSIENPFPSLSADGFPATLYGVKGFSAFLFFLVFTVLIAAGIIMGVHGRSGGWLLTTLSCLAYLGLFIKAGCLTSSSH